MSAVRNYAVVTASYWGFTLTDGAIRMLVLLHFYSLGYTPVHAGVSFPALRDGRHLRQSWRRLARGALWHPAHADDGSRLADRRPDVAVRPQSALERGASRSPGSWPRKASRASPRTSPRQPRNPRSRPPRNGGAGQLFKWVAWFTGSKNAMKGAGFFVGGLLLESIGFRGALWLMAAASLSCWSVSPSSLPRTLGKAKASKTFRELFAKTRSDQSDGCCSCIPVRLARRVVRRRPAGVSLQPGLALHARLRASSRVGRSAMASFRLLRHWSSAAARMGYRVKCLRRGCGVLC